MTNFDHLTQFLEDLVAQSIPGVDCIVKKGHTTVYRHHAGYADREAGIPIQGDERFYLYSATKVITCVAALQLMEWGKFCMNDPISKFLPEFSNMQIMHTDSMHQVTYSPAVNPITFRQLFTMSAGFDYCLDFPALDKVRKETQGRISTREGIRALAAQPLHYEPGTKWGYSLAHDVLGALIEVLSGERLGDYMKKHIFDPLGMKHTGFSRTPEVLQAMMPQYRYNPASGTCDRIPLDNEYIWGSEYESGGAGLISCLDDYILFAEMLAHNGTGENGARILSPATVELMRTNHLNDFQRTLFCYPQMPGYGYGLGVRTMMDRTCGGILSPIGEFGWSGAAGVFVLIDPENQISMFYVMQVRDYPHEWVHPQLTNALYASL